VKFHRGSFARGLPSPFVPFVDPFLLTGPHACGHVTVDERMARNPRHEPELLFRRKSWNLVTWSISQILNGPMGSVVRKDGSDDMPEIDSGIENDLQMT
jgi:hypothetical protein